MAEARDTLAAGNVSARELTEAHLAAIEGARDLNVFITETPDRALADADASDAPGRRRECWGRWTASRWQSRICSAPTGCRRRRHRTSSKGSCRHTNTVTENLRNAGAIMLGKTNLDEFAMGSSNETSYFGKVENPWQREGDNRPLVPGGSSGGSASAVSGRLCLGAIGTDTGGSIRQPAAFCGIVGMKPTYGRCSRWGIVAFASSLDQAGPMTRTVRDAAILLGGMAGFDPKDSTSAEMVAPDFEARLDGGVQGLRIGIPAEYAVDGMNTEIAALWDRGKAWLTDAGAELVDVSLPHTKYALPAYYIIAPAEPRRTWRGMTACASDIAKTAKT